MSCRLTFHNAAERELTDAAAYYDNSRPGLGNSFIDALRIEAKGRRRVGQWYGGTALARKDGTEGFVGRCRTVQVI